MTKRKRTYRAHEYRGWLLQRDGGRDMPWTAWQAGRIRLRAETLASLRAFVNRIEPRA